MTSMDFWVVIFWNILNVALTFGGIWWLYNHTFWPGRRTPGFTMIPIICILAIPALLGTFGLTFYVLMRSGAYAEFDLGLVSFGALVTLICLGVTAFAYIQNSGARNSGG
jgi:hypothetical protein